MDAEQHWYRSPMSFPPRWPAEEHDLTVIGDRAIESVATFFGHRVADGCGGFLYS
jgi:hypothetical protein